MSVSAHQHHPQSVPIVRHFTVQERAGLNPLLLCWCGATLEVDYSYEAGGTSEGRSRLNVFLDQHDSCQPKEAMQMINPENLPDWAKPVMDNTTNLIPAAGNLNICSGVYTHGFSQPVPVSGVAYSYISPTDFETIRAIIREEVHRALHPEREAIHD